MAGHDRETIGHMRRRLMIEAPTGTADGVGGMAVVFQPAGAVWANVEWLRGDERWRADHAEQAGQCRITLRHRTGLDASMRFRDGMRIFDIKAVGDPDGAGRRLVCLCEEISP
jgi:SPP1 family predicted phage head-tail adaptor